MGTATATALVGRAGPLARLAGALDDLGGDGPRVVLVSGEAGVGKTRLVSELKVLAAERGVSVAVGRCLDAGAAIWPLAPLREILAAWRDELSAESLDEVLGPAGDMLRALLHDDDVADSPAADRLGGLVLGAVRRRDVLGPNVLVVEDLHWADESTRALFVLLTRLHHLRRTLIVGTYRADELHRRHPLRPILAEVARRARPARVSLEPLDLTDATTLLAAGGIDDRTVVTQMHQRSGGNPVLSGGARRRLPGRARWHERDAA